MRAATPYQRSLAVLAVTVLAAGEFWRHLMGWWGWGALAVIVTAASLVELVRMRVAPRRLPAWLLVFVVLAGLSIIWSPSPRSAALAVVALLATSTVAVMLAVCLTWTELLETLSTALRWVLGASLVFELFVAVVIRDRLLPLWTDYSLLDTVPSTFYWSRGLLFEGGRIQGIVGNANVLSMLALLALIVFACRLIARQGSPLWAWFWIAVAALDFALSRSATVIVATVAVVGVAVVLVLARRTTGRTRQGVLVGSILAAVVLVVVAVLARGPLLGLLGRSPDLTHRLDIWQRVGELAIERPALGWGWGFWAPWQWPIEGLGELNEIGYLSAHNSWLDVFLQLGVIGLVLFAILVAGTLMRSWGMATERTPRSLGIAGMGWPLNAIPLLLLVALLVQSIAESALLWEFGFALLVIIAVKTGWSDPERAEAVTG